MDFLPIDDDEDDPSITDDVTMSIFIARCAAHISYERTCSRAAIL